MGNLEETKPISKIIIEANGDEYEFTGGGQPGPDSVGSEQIQDGAVQEVDLHEDVKEKLNKPVDKTVVQPVVEEVVNEVVPQAIDGKLDDMTVQEFEDIFGEAPSGGSSFEDRVSSLENRVTTLEGPESIGTEQIRDSSVQTEDLSDDVKGQIQKTYDQSNESMSMNFDER